MRSPGTSARTRRDMLLATAAAGVLRRLTVPPATTFCAFRDDLVISRCSPAPAGFPTAPDII